MMLALVFLFRVLLLVAAARLLYDLITPITPGFLIALAALIVLRLMLTRYGL